MTFHRIQRLLRLSTSVAVLAFGGLSGVASASLLVLDRNSRGAYDSTGNYNESGYINEFPVGRICCNGFEARNWIRFDIPILAGGISITSATLRTEFNYISPDGSEVLELHEVTTAASSLGHPWPPRLSDGLPVYQDLGDGQVFGSATILATDTGMLAIALNSFDVEALNLLAHGVPPSGGNGNWFGLGGSLSTLGTDRGVEALFCSPDCLLLDVRYNTTLKTELALECSGDGQVRECFSDPAPDPDPQPVPEPATLILVGASTLAFATSRRRRH